LEVKGEKLKVRCLALNLAGRIYLTHPGITAFADPLFAFGGKRVKNKKMLLPSFPLAEERVVGRSKDRVSKRSAFKALGIEVDT